MSYDLLLFGCLLSILWYTLLSEFHCLHLLLGFPLIGLLFFGSKQVSLNCHAQLHFLLIFVLLRHEN
jgi:hypothetical protein